MVKAWALAGAVALSQFAQVAYGFSIPDHFALVETSSHAINGSRPLVIDGQIVGGDVDDYIHLHPRDQSIGREGVFRFHFQRTHESTTISKETTAAGIYQDIGGRRVKIVRIAFLRNIHERRFETNVFGWTLAAVAPLDEKREVAVRRVSGNEGEFVVVIDDNPRPVLPNNGPSLENVNAQTKSRDNSDKQSASRNDINQAREFGHSLLRIKVPLGEVNILLAFLGIVFGGGVGGYGFYRLLNGVENRASYVYLLGGFLAGAICWGLGLGLLGLG